MGWPVSTRATDFLVTAAVWNADVVSNMNSLMALKVRKPSDESLTANTTLQNDDHLVLTVAANEVWQVECFLRFTASSAGDLKTAWTFPASGELNVIANGEDTSNIDYIHSNTYTTSPTSNIQFGGNGANTSPAHFKMLLTNAGTAGTLQLQWAQSASDGTATVVKTNSTLWAVKLA
jgi:hypothetical protein